ncbi:hypothetical protein VNI00_009783 [Paramarasmius palmivorus]|uniref:F-box domain-containing protein n=1 Tax=Paramarasmius palmivorus TaxID=297713 RepID=A0AAW0CN98_9AGAR
MTDAPKTLPPELVAKTLDHLRSNKRALMAVSLASHSWNIPARQHLFRNLGNIPGEEDSETKIKEFIDLCKNEYSTIPAAGPRKVTLVSSVIAGSGTIRFFVEALLEDDLARKVFWNVEELVITCSQGHPVTARRRAGLGGSDWSQLVQSGCFPKVRKLAFTSCILTEESISQMGAIIRSLERLEFLSLEFPWFHRFTPERSLDVHGIGAFPDTLRRLILEVHDAEVETTNALQLFSTCSTLEEVTVECLSRAHIEDLQYFLQHTPARIQRMTLSMASSYLHENDGIILLKQVIASSTSRVEEMVIETFMDDFVYIFGGTSETELPPPENLKKVVLTSAVKGMEWSLENILVNDSFFGGLEKILLLCIEIRSAEELETAGWDEDSEAVGAESDPYREGAKRAAERLKIFEHTQRVKPLLEALVKYRAEL